ncbi:hypothetical protein Nepgr_007650 [Nepenthes gracilis]|uniref:Uncharacterized protein n=1 Tax=Nepenthes gracilis TaxID=150966 RepID=A0AAD3S7D3_NEPGR|nr:hypothetical protein Nepgr_007650 [Nepenthes gracilis]
MSNVSLKDWKLNVADSTASAVRVVFEIQNWQFVSTFPWNTVFFGAGRGEEEFFFVREGERRFGLSPLDRRGLIRAIVHDTWTFLGCPLSISSVSWMSLLPLDLCDEK